MNQIVTKPVITEKSMRLASQGTYLFDVSASANKVQILEAIKLRFKVDPIMVRTLILKGKVKKFRGISGKRSDKKRAFITVKKGQKIGVFEMEEPKGKK